jgi:hypothetical protein
MNFLKIILRKTMCFLCDAENFVGEFRGIYPNHQNTPMCDFHNMVKASSGTKDYKNLCYACTYLMSVKKYSIEQLTNQTNEDWKLAWNGIKNTKCSRRFMPF